MSDETQQPATADDPPSIEASDFAKATPDKTAGNAEPTAEASIPPSPSDSAEATPGEQGKSSEPAPEPLEQPNITVEKHGNDVTITEVMKPTPEPKTPNQDSLSSSGTGQAETAQTARFEPFAKGNPAKQMRKRKKIDAILELFSPTPSRKTGLRGVNEVTNKDVQKTLHVSDATATRYLETLEKEGKIKQVGKTGRGVVYKKI